MGARFREWATFMVALRGRSVGHQYGEAVCKGVCIAVEWEFFDIAMIFANR
jgi:hypothetical protein